LDAPKTPAEALAARLSERFGEKLDCRIAVRQVTAELAAEDLYLISFGKLALAQ
jgi:hypothetical protein